MKTETKIGTTLAAFVVFSSLCIGPQASGQERRPGDQKKMVFANPEIDAQRGK